MLILHNLMSGKTDYWIMLELKDGRLIDISWAGKPFKGTNLDVNLYAEKLAEQAVFRGLPLAEIHIVPIKRSA